MEASELILINYMVLTVIFLMIIILIIYLINRNVKKEINVYEKLCSATIAKLSREEALND